MNIDLGGRIAVVTGASRKIGIGAAIAPEPPIGEILEIVSPSPYCSTKRGTIRVRMVSITST